MDRAILLEDSWIFDGSFVAFITSELEALVGHLLSSNKTQNIKMVIQDRLKLSSISMELKVSSYICQMFFLQ